MGHQSRIRAARKAAKPEIIHREKLFGGRETAMDVHRQLAWHGGRCNGCGSGQTVIQIATHMLTKEIIDKHPSIAARIMMAAEDGQIPSWKSKYGPMTMVGVAYACAACRQSLESAAAKGPSYVLVEIDRGPGEDKIVSQVPIARGTAGADA